LDRRSEGKQGAEEEDGGGKAVWREGSRGGGVRRITTEGDGGRGQAGGERRMAEGARGGWVLSSCVQAGRTRCSPSSAHVRSRQQGNAPAALMSGGLTRGEAMG